MKKGFTLIELLTVIIILGVIGIIIVPIANSAVKEVREKLYVEQIQTIKKASEDWAYENRDLVPSTEGESITITIQELKRGGFLPPDIRDPRTNQPISNGLSIVITYKQDGYDYEINEIVSNIEYDKNNPVLILNGQPLETIEINEDYVEKNAIAKDADGNILDNVVITYYDNNKEITNIDTSLLKAYTIEYKVTDSNNLTSVINRTVIVSDTKAPTITLPDKVTINSTEAVNYDLMEGVYISDNSNKTPSVDISGFDTSVGEKIVSYKACDNSNNCATEKRIIVIK